MKFIYYVVLVACMVFLASCSEKETISGAMSYKKGLVQTEYYAVVNSNSPCAKLLEIVQKQIDERKADYNREWNVSFSGSSVDSELAKADEEALIGFDITVESLKKWKTTIDEQIASNDFGPGAFKVGYVVRVSRNKVLKESEPVIFEYRYKK